MKWIYSSIIILLFTACVSAQSFGSITYNVAIPTEKLADYIDNTSWRGFGLEGRWFQANNISFGISFGWNVFDQRTTDLIQVADESIGGTVGGTQIRVVNSFPMMATGHFQLQHLIFHLDYF